MNYADLQRKMSERKCIISKIKELDSELTQEGPAVRRREDGRTKIMEERRLRIEQTRRRIRQQQEQKKQQQSFIQSQCQELMDQLKELRRQKIKARLQQLQEQAKGRAQFSKQANVAIRKLKQMDRSASQASQVSKASRVSRVSRISQKQVSSSHKSQSQLSEHSYGSNSRRVTLAEIKQHARNYKQAKQLKFKLMQQHRQASKPARIRFARNQAMHELVKQEERGRKQSVIKKKEQLQSFKKKRIEYAAAVKSKFISKIRSEEPRVKKGSQPNLKMPPVRGTVGSRVVQRGSLDVGRTTPRQ